MKQILLLGDSIRLGYCGTVRNALKDEALVFYPKDNCRSTHHTLLCLKDWCNELIPDPEQISVIHWNNGHWDAAHWYGGDEPLTPPEDYGRMLRMVYGALRKFFPNAKIIFATNTPMNPNGTNSPNPRTTDDMRKYNEIAKRTMAELNVQVNDLFAFAEPFGSELYADYAHFTGEGFRRLGEEVAEVIRAAL